jgi:sec-independent protein translocase protein TatC
MARAIRTIGHEDRLSLVEHLDELRARLIVCAIALGLAFGLCFWQNHRLLSFINHPLERETAGAVAHGRGPLGQTTITQQALLRMSKLLEQQVAILSAPHSGLHNDARARIAALDAQYTLAVAKLPRTPGGDRPVTLGIGEPFTQTVTVAFYFAVLLALPVILYELYGFVLPAFSPTERAVATPLMAAIPTLFVAGLAFGYFVVLPAAVRFLQNFNSTSFNVLVQASTYYRFAALTLLAMGLVFQVPVGVLATVRAGVVTPRQLRRHRRYAIVLAAVIAALLPGDAITMVLETLPLIVLYELSILVAAFFERRARRRGMVNTPVPAAAAAPGAQAGEAPIPPIKPPREHD